MVKANKYRRSQDAMKAARWVLSEYRRHLSLGEKVKIKDLEKEAAQSFDVGEKYIQNARLLILSELDPLIWEVDTGFKDVAEAIEQVRATKSGSSAYGNSDRGIYALVEEGDDTAVKIGHGNFVKRFNAAQSGNKRPLLLKYAWRCNRSVEIPIEREILAEFPVSSGGGEWIVTDDPTAIYKSVVNAGATWIPLVHGFDKSGRKIKL